MAAQSGRFERKQENKNSVQRETCYLSATVVPRLGFKLCCWMLVYGPTASPINTLLEEGRRRCWACAVLEGAFFITYNCAAQTEHLRIGREKEKKGSVCAATPLRLFPSMPARVSLKYRRPKKRTGPARLFSLLFFLDSCPPLWLFPF